MDVAITNANELKLEIERLKGLKTVQENAIKQHFNSPRAVLGTIVSIFYKNKTGHEGIDLSKFNIGNLFSKYILPLTLNKTLFRKSGFVVKALAAFASRKAVGLLNEKHVAAIWDKIKPHLPISIAEKSNPKKRTSFFSSLLTKQNKKAKGLKSV